MKKNVNVEMKNPAAVMSMPIGDVNEKELRSVGDLNNTCGTGAAIPCVIFIVTAFAAFV